MSLWNENIKDGVEVVFLDIIIIVMFFIEENVKLLWREESLYNINSNNLPVSNTV